MWQRYYLPANLDEALSLLDRYGSASRILAGGTDLILELERGARRHETLVDISRIPGLDTIRVVDGCLKLGPLVTHNQVVASAEALAHAYPLAGACRQVGSPQIRNRGTVVGNLVTASPANDTITPLWAMDAKLVVASRRRGTRTLDFEQFYLGVRRTALADDEMVIGIEVPLLRPTERGAFSKIGLRRAQAISLVNAAVVLDFEDAEQPAGAELRQNRVIRRARIALGAVAPTIVRATAAEDLLAGRELTERAIAEAADLAVGAARPISDIRAEAWYRLEMVKVLVSQSLRQLHDGIERADWPDQAVKLWGRGDGHVPVRTGASNFQAGRGSSISLAVNGSSAVLVDAHGKTLLAALRDHLGLLGTKEGCSEGECGACTVWLDGMAVMSCLVPAERADGCDIVTVEGLASPEGLLHPLQKAFIREGAVQCGYCTPGMLMSGANLLDEIPRPTSQQIQEGLSGNLCRCTGYYSIVKAVERAARGE